jgi:endo-1,4-beta-xylanase
LSYLSLKKIKIMKINLMHTLKLSIVSLALLTISCAKLDDIAGPKVTPLSFTDTTTPMKDALQGAGDFPIGVAISYNNTLNTPQYMTTIQKDFDIVTFENNMKHNTIVQNNGSLDFTAADAMVNKIGALNIHGHTLAWHSQQNTEYLNSFVSAASGDGPQRLANAGFEESSSALVNWTVQNSGNPGGSASLSVGSVAHSGTNSMQVTNGTNYSGEQWRVQVVSDAVGLIVGNKYKVSYWVKPSASGTIRLSTTPSALYQGDQNITGTDWQQITWTITANAVNTQIALDMGQLTGTFYIDDVSVNEILPPAGPQLIVNPGFEKSKSALTNWSVYNSGNPAGSATIGVGTVAHSGNRSMQITNGTNYAGEQYRVQVAADAVNLKVGTKYLVSYWVKPSADGSIRLSTAPSSQYQGDQSITGTEWQQITWTITANAAQTNIVLDMGQLTGTYYIDDVGISEILTSSGPIIDLAGIDNALNQYVTGMINHFKGKTKSWDVVNELFADNGSIRNDGNTSGSGTAGVFVWSEYLGRDMALKAFNYAKAADPTADLYINDYGLESNSAKLDALIAYVTEIKGKGAKVDGIGTQMHISTGTDIQGIASMFKKLAATGLKIKISELDIKMNPNGVSGFALDQNLQVSQADLYNFVVSSYIQNVPASQRGGITVWGLTDNQSWLSNGEKEFPLLYNKDYSRKMAYAGVIKALTGK